MATPGLPYIFGAALKTLHIPRPLLEHLEDKGSVLAGPKGAIWIENKDPRFLKLIRKSKGIEL